MALPGVRGSDHVGITVPDVEAATRFFVDVLGAEEFFTIGPFGTADADNPWMAEHLGVHPRAVIKALRMLRLANGTNLELFEYAAPDQRQAGPRNSDVGGYHVAFYVDDMDAAVAYLKSKGVTVQGDPVTMTEGPSAGLQWVYFLAPWGLQLELVSYPRGLAYETAGSRRLWTPKDPAK